MFDFINCCMHSLNKRTLGYMLYCINLLGVRLDLLERGEGDLIDLAPGLRDVGGGDL